MKTVLNFFDVLEDNVRAWLSKRPILYGMVAGVGAVLFFRGVWHIADDIQLGSVWSLALALTILLVTGSFVAHFVTNDVILSGLKKEKKIIEKTEEEVKSEIATLADIKKELKSIRSEMNKMCERMHG